MPTDLKQRTKLFALGILELSRELQPDRPASLLRSQLIRAGTGVGSNYRAARGARRQSRSDFIAKLTTAEGGRRSLPLAETARRLSAFPTERIRPLLQEANDLTAIFVTSIQTARANRR